MNRSFFLLVVVLIFSLLEAEIQNNEEVSKKKINGRLMNIDSLKTQLDILVNTNSISKTRISYTLFDCITNKTISLNGDQIEHAASSFKTYLAAYCFYLIEQKELGNSFLDENANPKKTKEIIDHINQTDHLNKKDKAKDIIKFVSRFTETDLTKMLFVSDNASTARIISKLPDNLDGLNDFIRNELGMRNSYIISWSNGEIKNFASVDNNISLVNGRHNTLTTNDQTEAWKRLFVDKSVIKDNTLRDKLLELLLYSYYSPMKEEMKADKVASKHGKIPYSAWGGSNPHSVLNDGGCILDENRQPKFIIHIQINDYSNLNSGEEIIKKMVTIVSKYLEKR